MRLAFVRPVLFIALVAVLALAGCETKVPNPNFPELTYSQLPPIKLNVARIDVDQQYRSPGKKPNVEQMFPVPPAKAAENWARDRLKAVGNDGVARFTVVQASVVEVPLKTTQGVQGWFTTDQSERYDATLEVKIDLIGGDGRQLGSVSARAGRRRTVPEDITLYGREKVWYEMTEALMNDINTALEQQVRENFGAYLVR